MWPFKRETPEDKIALAEWKCWQESAYPYDRMRWCGRCVTDHAIRGCNVVAHHGFVVIAHDAGLHVYTSLHQGKDFAFRRSKIAAGKFLLANRSTILHLRELYAHHFDGQPAVAVQTDADIREVMSIPE